MVPPPPLFLLLPLGLASRAATAFAPSRLAFAPRATHPSDAGLRSTDGAGDDWAVIKADTDADDVWDLSLGGVGLTMESAIKISGDVDGGEAEAKGLIRYKKPTEFDGADVRGVMDSAGVTIVCGGLGKELYKDPGMTVVREVTYAPSDAVRNALSSVPSASVSEAKSVVLNFLGGDDLMWAEVLDACSLAVEGLDIAGDATVTFNSLCHKDFPNEYCSVAVVAKRDGADSDEGLSGVARSVARGEVYLYQGKWYTVTEEDIN